MLQKTTLGIAVVAILIAAISFFIPHGSSGTLSYTGAGETLNSIQLTPSASFNGGTDLYSLGWNSYANRFNSASATPLIDLSGNWVGNVSSSNGQVVTGNVIEGEGAFLGPFSTSTTLTPAQFCKLAVIQFANTTALATLTLPSVASTTGSAGLCPFPPGTFSMDWVQNISTNTIDTVIGAGMQAQAASGTTAAATFPPIPAGDTVQATGIVSTIATDTIEAVLFK